MHARVRTAVTTATLLALTAAPLAVSARSASAAGTAEAGGRAVAAREGGGVDAEALSDAIAGLPSDEATAALVRVGGTDGTWRGSSGVRDLRSGRDALPGARFRAGSTTKVVTAAMVLQLAAERRIDLGAPVQRYLPGLVPDTFAPISVRQLLNHTSGIQAGDGLGDTFDELYAHRFASLPPREVVASAVAKGPEFAPGTRQHYLNINYTVLGLLVEKVTGRSYASQAERRVFGPLGMRDTSFPGADPRIHGPHHHGYQAVERPDGSTRLVDVTDWNQTDRFAAGDMISTTADLERLLTGLFSGKVVPRPQLQEMFTVPDLPGATMSAGLQRFVAPTGQVFWVKSGSRYGYSTAVGATRDLSRTLVYSVNATDAKGEEMSPVAQRIVMAALGG